MQKNATILSHSGDCIMGTPDAQSFVECGNVPLTPSSKVILRVKCDTRYRVIHANTGRSFIPSFPDGNSLKLISV